MVGKPEGALAGEAVLLGPFIQSGQSTRRLTVPSALTASEFAQGASISFRVRFDTLHLTLPRMLKSLEGLLGELGIQFERNIFRLSVYDEEDDTLSATVGLPEVEQRLSRCSHGEIGRTIVVASSEMDLKCAQKLMGSRAALVRLSITRHILFPLLLPDGCS